MNVFVIGSSSWDTLIYVDDLPKTLLEDVSLWANKTFQTIGSTAAGKTLALDVLGHQVTLATDLGDDPERQFVLDVYQKHPKINLRLLNSNHTTTHTNIMYGEGHRLSIFTQLSSEVVFDPTLEEEIKNSDVVFLNINSYCKQYIPMIQKHRKFTVVDIHDYDLGNPYHKPFIDVADILFVSGVQIEDQASFLKEHIGDKKVVVITNGKKGSLAMDEKGNIYQQNAFLDLPLVDANGAGDTFSVAFTMYFLEHHSIKKALTFASIAGAMACESETLYHPDATFKTIHQYMHHQF